MTTAQIIRKIEEQIATMNDTTLGVDLRVRAAFAYDHNMDALDRLAANGDITAQAYLDYPCPDDDADLTPYLAAESFVEHVRDEAEAIASWENDGGAC